MCTPAPLPKEPSVLVHRNSGIRYITENWDFLSRRFKNLDEAVEPVLRSVNTEGFRRMLVEMAEAKPRRGAVRATLCSIPQARTTIERPFPTNNIWSEDNLEPRRDGEKDTTGHWFIVPFTDLVKVRAFLSHINDQISGANESSVALTNVLAVTKITDGPNYIVMTATGETLQIGGPGDSHNLSFWIEPLLGAAPALLPYMSDTFIIDWKNNPLAGETLFRKENERVWHHTNLGPLLGVTAGNLLNEVGNICKTWQDAQRSASMAPPEVRKLHKQRYPETADK